MQSKLRFKLYDEGAIFRNVRPQYFSRMVYDEVTYVLASLCLLGFSGYHLRMKEVSSETLWFLNVLTTEKVLQNVVIWVKLSHCQELICCIDKIIIA
jgi:hypothetical protein